MIVGEGLADIYSMAQADRPLPGSKLASGGRPDEGNQRVTLWRVGSLSTGPSGAKSVTEYSGGRT